MRNVTIAESLGAAFAAAALLVACGSSSELAPIVSGPAIGAASPAAGGLGAGGTSVVTAPTPVAAPTPISVPTPTTSSTPFGGVPSASPRASAAPTP